METESETSCTLVLSSFDFPDQAHGRVSLRRSSNPEKLTYRFIGSVSHTACPIMLTSWSSKYVYIALPPLDCKPKLIRLRHSRDDEAEMSTGAVCQTLNDPVYFPSTTLKKDARMVYLENTPVSDGPKPKKRDLLALGLNFHDAEKSPSTPSPHQRQDEPDLLTWTISRKEGWRDWDRNVDEQTEEIEDRDQAYRKLRGSFVSQEQRFNVIVRSGLNWTKKAFLSCS